MIHTNDLTTLRESLLTEREALVAAAVLPSLPANECLVRIHDRDEYENDVATRSFLSNTKPISGTRLRRVAFDHKPNDDGVELTPTPHGTRDYTVSGHDFHAFRIGGDPDFDDTDQTLLSDFGFEPSPVDGVHLGVEVPEDDFARRPRVPC
jgi:hypothetical protein